MFGKKVVCVFLALVMSMTVVLAGCSSSSYSRSSSSSSSSKSTSSYDTLKRELDLRDSWWSTLGTNIKLATQGLTIPDGYTGWVVGNVSNVYFAADSNGQPTFIDFNPPGYEDAHFFTAIIWAEDLPAFDSMNLQSLLGKEVAVRGSVYTYNYTRKQVKLTSPSQISVCPV